MTIDEKASSEKTPVSVDHPSISTKVQGVWKVLTLKETFSLKPSKWIDWAKYIETFPSVKRFMKDVYMLDRTLVFLYLFARAWKAIEPGITVYITSQLFTTIEDFLRDGKGDGWAIGKAIAFELCSIIMTSLSTCGERWVVPKLQLRTRQFFEDRWFRENLRYDVQTLMYSKKHCGSAMEAWQSFQGVIETFSNMLGLVTILSSMFFNHHGGPLFTFICLIYPLLTGNGQYSPIQPMIVFSDNEDYLRSQALRRLVDPDFREDIVTSNVAEHILQEYTKAKAALGDKDRDFSFFERPNDPVQEILQNVANNLPVMYFALRAVFSPKSFTLSALAVLRQQSSVLRYNVYMCFSLFSGISRTFDQIRFLYTVEIPRLTDGEVDYKATSGRGMAFELRDVLFEYPGSKTKVGALNGVSLKIEPGQLVVIVGSNGSGKSTLIKLLTRMYDVTSGELLVDGVLIQKYKMSHLHEATAILTQNHSIYPLSLAENVGMGYADHLNNVEMIHESIKKGGAEELIEKLKDGLQTNIDPIKTAWGYEIDHSKHSLLQDVLDTLELPAQVSGGERQRVVASRAFMRLQSPSVNFVAVDEPSSALDPRGELQLFDKLRGEAAGKTMIFVTHRFGHLTKYADLIICMKDGKIAESGKHQELLDLDGEYATLYKIQAQAFSTETASSEKKVPGTPPDSCPTVLL